MIIATRLALSDLLGDEIGRSKFRRSLDNGARSVRQRLRRSLGKAAYLIGWNEEDLDAIMIETSVC